MSCELRAVASVGDIRAVRIFLFPDTSPTQTDADRDEDEDGSREELWDDKWNWKLDGDERKEKEEDGFDGNADGKRKNEADTYWMQNCFVSLSPTGELLVLARKQRAVFLAPKWDGEEKSDMKTKFQVVWKGELVKDPGDNVTALLCLPLASQRRSGAGGVDWTCVAVGFSSGHLRLYTEKGCLVLSQLLNRGSEPVLRLKARSRPVDHSSSGSRGELPEQLLVLFPRFVVTFDGFGLVQTLRALRNRIARLQARDHATTAPPPLLYERWSLDGITGPSQDVSDCEDMGPQATCLWDHLHQACISGTTPSARLAPPSCDLLVVAGRRPFLAFRSTPQGGGSPALLTEVAHAVASKVRTALVQAASGFLGLGSPSAATRHPEEEKEETPPTPTDCRWGLADTERQADSICPSPCRTMVSVTDNLGRVTLLDVTRGLAVRMWKGYREAQCGWLSVWEEEDPTGRHKKSRRRRAQFLALYAPRKGTLEVWALQHGPRVAAFPVPRGGVLMAPQHSLMGKPKIGTTGSVHRHRHTDSGTSHQCVFLSPDGVLRVVRVPFHLALGDRSGRRARDLHLLRNLRGMVGSGEPDDHTQGEVRRLLSDIKTASVKVQALRVLARSRNVSADMLQTALQALQPDNSAGEPDVDVLARLNQQLSQLLRMYTFSVELAQAPPAYDSLQKEPNMEDLSVTLMMSKAETDHLVRSTLELDKEEVGQEATEDLPKRENVDKTSVRFEDEGSLLSLHEFLSCFEVGGEEVELGEDMADRDLQSLGCLLVGVCIDRPDCLDSWAKHMTLESDNNLLLTSKDLLILALQAWLSRAPELTSALEMTSFCRVLEAISILPDHDISTPEDMAAWWDTARSVLSRSAKLSRCLSGSVCCRATGARLEQKQSGVTSDLEDWEGVSMDTVRWNACIRRLEQLLVLQRVVRSGKRRSLEPDAKAEPLPKLPPVEIKCLTLATFSDRGPGAVAEWVSRWVGSTGLTPEALVAADEDSEVVSSLKLLQSSFPGHHLSTDVVLANWAWELSLEWQRHLLNPQPTNGGPTVVQWEVGAAVRCLRLVQREKLRRGAASMLWAAHVGKAFAGAAQLLERAGKGTVGDRACLRELGFGETKLPSFLTACQELLELLLETGNYEDEPDQGEDEQEERGPPPLHQLALRQPVPQESPLILHLQLAMVLRAMMALGLKGVRPLSLFNSHDREAMVRHDLGVMRREIEADPTLTASRQQFLQKALLGAAQSIQNGDEVSTASYWYGRCLDLAQHWGLDRDPLRRHYICALYTAGHDLLAEEMLSTVQEGTRLASQLLLVVGQRLYHVVLLHQPSSSAHRLARLNPEASNWLQGLDQIARHSQPSTLALTSQLLAHVLARLPDGHPEMCLALALLPALQALQEEETVSEKDKASSVK